MIFTILFYVFGFILTVVAKLLPSWSIYPPEILEAFKFFGSSLDSLNFIFDMQTLCAALIFLIQFEVAYYGARLVVSVISGIRGHKVIDI